MKRRTKLGLWGEKDDKLDSPQQIEGGDFKVIGNPGIQKESGKEDAGDWRRAKPGQQLVGKRRTWSEGGFRRT